MENLFLLFACNLDYQKATCNHLSLLEKEAGRPNWKGKGDQEDCNNYHDITLLCVPGKVTWPEEHLGLASWWVRHRTPLHMPLLTD